MTTKRKPNDKRRWNLLIKELSKNAAYHWNQSERLFRNNCLDERPYMRHRIKMSIYEHAIAIVKRHMKGVK